MAWRTGAGAAAGAAGAACTAGALGAGVLVGAGSVATSTLSDAALVTASEALSAVRSAASSAASRPAWALRRTTSSRGTYSPSFTSPIRRDGSRNSGTSGAGMTLPDATCSPLDAAPAVWGKSGSGAVRRDGSGDAGGSVPPRRASPEYRACWRSATRLFARSRFSASAPVSGTFGAEPAAGKAAPSELFSAAACCAATVSLVGSLGD